MFNTLSISSWARHALEIAKRSPSGQSTGLLRPPDNVLPEPQLTATAPRSPDGIGEVFVPGAIRRKTTGICQADEPGDVVSVEKVVQIDEAGHGESVVALEERSTRVVLEQRARAGRRVVPRVRGLACHARPPKATQQRTSGMGVPFEPVPAVASDQVLGIVIGTEFVGSLIETMRMASAVLTESVDEQMLPVYDQNWLMQLARELDGFAAALDRGGPPGGDPGSR